MLYTIAAFGTIKKLASEEIRGRFCYCALPSVGIREVRRKDKRQGKFAALPGAFCLAFVVLCARLNIASPSGGKEGRPVTGR